MDDLLIKFGKFTLRVGLFFVSTVFLGTMLYFVYPHIHAMFPGAVSAGVLARTVSWWDCVCITIIFGTLIRSVSPGELRRNNEEQEEKVRTGR